MTPEFRIAADPGFPGYLSTPGWTPAIAQIRVEEGRVLKRINRSVIHSAGHFRK
jgi:hypothetical protein